MSPFEITVWICVAVTAACWLASVITREYSWTDRIWSIVPAVYAWVFAGASGDPRAILVAILITVWALRLTLNFMRRGGYAPGGEDYRWAVLRARMPGWGYQLFNVVFIAGFQNVLLWAIVLPVWTMTLHDRPLGAWDAVAAAAFVGLLAMETIADQQRWNFHRAGAPGGVLTTGLYRYSRHPNYFAEVAQWWVVVAFAVIAAGTPLLWTAAGAVGLTALFVGSTVFTEQISAERHPEYADYKRRTSPFIPWPPRRAVVKSQASEA